MLAFLFASFCDEPCKGLDVADLSSTLFFAKLRST